MGILDSLFKDQEKLNAELLESSEKGDVLGVQEVLKKGADINAKAKDDEGNTALIWAAYKGHQEIAEMLINAGADLDVKDNANNTALILAARKNSKEIAEMLIKAGADVNAKDMSDNTVLRWASLKDHKEIVEMLIKAGADVNAKDMSDNTALDYLDKDKYPETADLLKDAMAHPEKYKPLNEEEKGQIATQVQAMNVQQIKELPECNPKLLGQLCIVKGLMEVVLGKLDYSQQKALYAGTYKDVSPKVRVAMEQMILNNSRLPQKGA